MQVEDEFHVLMECTIYENGLNFIFNEASIQCKNNTHILKYKQLIWLMSSESKKANMSVS